MSANKALATEPDLRYKNSEFSKSMKNIKKDTTPTKKLEGSRTLARINNAVNAVKGVN